jgi:transcriptional regulator with XRE-family HTH domain
VGKSIHSKQYKVALSLLKKARVESGLSQVELAIRLNTTQTFVSKCERGERRLDLLEVRAFCEAIGISFPDFIQVLENKLVSSY